MLKIFCLITGDDYSLLKIDTPASKRKISALASLLLIPVITWFVIGLSIGNSILNLSLFTSCLIGTSTGMIIFIIERAILTSGTNKWLIALRVCMGLLIAVLGSVFIDEIIFKEDILQQVFLDRRELIEADRNLIRSQYESSIDATESKVGESYQQWLQALAEAKQESDGSGGSGQRGIHAIAKLKLKISQQHEDTYNAYKNELSKLQEDLKKRLESSEKEIQERISGNSILFRVKSLFRLVFSDKWVLAVYCVFTLLLFLLEFIVIIMKHSLAQTNYERRVEAMETIGGRRITAITVKDSRSFDPSDLTEPVLKANRALKTPVSIFTSYEHV